MGAWGLKRKVLGGESFVQYNGTLTFGFDIAQGRVSTVSLAEANPEPPRKQR